MVLQRESILGLIGSRRYHSAILTTFSFDFYFFEMKVMRWLRSCGVRNVNVLIDGHFYSALMEQMSGEEMQLASGYSLYPVFQKSIFHPKIWLLIGEKEGLLVVGSGNLTSAGNGNNEEIWGAFHFDVRLTENTQVFSAAWSYLSQLCSTLKGYTREKTTRWIFDHSNWLKDLPKVTSTQFYRMTDKSRIAFLSNSGAETIWEQLSVMLSQETIEEVTTMSPFYDTKGIALTALYSLFAPTTFNVIIDTAGSVPSELRTPEDYMFFDWYTVGVSKSLRRKEESQGPKSKLHAKVIHFRTTSGTEFCLFGSANVTPAGLGLPGASANTEVSLLIESTDGNLLDSLGIKLKSPSKLSDFKAEDKLSIYEAIIAQNRGKIKLISAEWLYDELHLFAAGDYDHSFNIQLSDREQTVLDSIKINEFGEEVKAKPSIPIQNVHHVQLYDAENQAPISNKVLLTDHFSMVKTHPNPRTEDFERIYDEIQGGELTKVLELLPFAMNDDTEQDAAMKVISKGQGEKPETETAKQPEKLYDLSSYKPISNQVMENGLLLSSLSLRVLDVLKFMSTKSFTATVEEELREDEQESDISTISGLDEAELKIVRNIPLSTLKAERRKLLGYFKQLSEHQQGLIYFSPNSKDYRPTLTDLSRYLIALELLHQFGGKSEKYVEEDKEHFFGYIDFNGEAPYGYDNVKACSINLIGEFLMLARYGFKQYDFEYTRIKVDQLRKEALTTSIACLLNLRWKDSEGHYLNTLLLNCLHYLGDKTSAEFNDLWPKIETPIKDRVKSFKNVSSDFQANWSRFENKIMPAFKRTIGKLETKSFDTVAAKGDLLYKSPWGYCLVKDISREKTFTLTRPGFLWSEEFADFIKHSNDEVYAPIKLPQFIRVTI